MKTTFKYSSAHVFGEDKKDMVNIFFPFTIYGTQPVPLKVEGR
jgi:hypothetical protein